MLFFTESCCSRIVFVYCDDIFPELEENKMPVNADFHVQVTNIEIPFENEFDSTAIGHNWSLISKFLRLIYKRVEIKVIF